MPSPHHPDPTAPDPTFGAPRPPEAPTLPPGVAPPQRAASYWEQQVPPRATMRAKAPPADAHCTGCGTSIPHAETECAFCRLQRLPPQGARTLVLHWLVFGIMMSVVFGGGYLLGQ